MKYCTYLADSNKLLGTLSSNSIDSVVTDPPAGIDLLGLEWDSNRGGKESWQKWLSKIMKEAHRTLKPGAHGFVWALPRVSHWTAIALEDAGFIVRDVVTHVYGSGFPKNVAIDKAIDRAKYTDTSLLYRATSWIRERRDILGLTNSDLDRVTGVRGGAAHWTALPPNGQPNIPTAERWTALETLLGPPPAWLKDLIRPGHERGENWKKRRVVGEYTKNAGGLAGVPFESTNHKITEPMCMKSIAWKGWGTALKPASEHWILIQKPSSSHNIAANILKHGTGGINIDKCRIPAPRKIPSSSYLDFRGGCFLWEKTRSETSFYQQHPLGRFPSNFLYSRSNTESCVGKILDRQSGTGASEFFKSFSPDLPFVYCKKPATSEKGTFNMHPTVKPLALMRYLCNLVTPPGGLVLDPFMGSGTTGVAALKEGFRFVGIESNQTYFEIAKRRLEASSNE